MNNFRRWLLVLLSLGVAGYALYAYAVMVPGSTVAPAMKATYAAQENISDVAPLLPDSKQLEYRAHAYLYRDVYFGGVRFAGHEVVYLSERAIWSMSYAGGLLPNAQARFARRQRRRSGAGDEAQAATVQAQFARRKGPARATSAA